MLPHSGASALIACAGGQSGEGGGLACFSRVVQMLSRGKAVHGSRRMCAHLEICAGCAQHVTFRSAQKGEQGYHAQAMSV